MAFLYEKFDNQHDELCNLLSLLGLLKNVNIDLELTLEQNLFNCIHDHLKTVKKDKLKNVCNEFHLLEYEKKQIEWNEFLVDLDKIDI